MTEATPNKFFSAVAPKQSDRPHARQFAVGDEWHPPEGEAGEVQYWNGTAWATKLDKKSASPSAPGSKGAQTVGNISQVKADDEQKPADKTVDDIEKEEAAAEAEEVQRNLDAQKKLEEQGKIVDAPKSTKPTPPAAVSKSEQKPRDALTKGRK